MVALVVFPLVLLLFAPGPVGFVLGQGSRSWWWPLLVAGLVFAGFVVLVVLANANTFGDEGGAGPVLLLYLLAGAWGTVTAAVGVLVGRALSERGCRASSN